MKENLICIIAYYEMGIWSDLSDVCNGPHPRTTLVAIALFVEIDEMLDEVLCTYPINIICQQPY